VFDDFRNKWVVCTPEEWVRQHVAHWLVNDRGISKSRIRIEIGFELNGLAKRVDILVFDDDYQPWLLVECKRPEVKLDDSVYQQAVRYNLVWKVPQLLLTNGLDSQWLEVSFNE
jgi:Type I restriction enzyme R protein N terminus (HSDR_N)